MKDYNFLKGLFSDEYLEFLHELSEEYKEQEARRNAREREIIEAAREAEERGGRHWPL